MADTEQPQSSPQDNNNEQQTTEASTPPEPTAAASSTDLITSPSQQPLIAEPEEKPPTKAAAASGYKRPNRPEEYTVEDQYSYVGPTSQLYKVRMTEARERRLLAEKSGGESKELETIQKKTFWERMAEDERLLQLTYLASMGLLSGFICVIVGTVVYYLTLARKELWALYDEWWYKYLIYVLYMQLMCLGAALAIKYISRFAAGSGIPEVKSILTGVSMPRYVSFRTMIAKLVSVTLVQAGGLPVGRIGPFVHISTIIVHLFASHVPYFRRLKRNYILYLQVMAAAAATGVAAVLGTPIGGTLFSIEATATFFMMNNLWKSIFAALCATIVFSYCRFTVGATNFTPLWWSLTPEAPAGKSNTGVSTPYEQEEMLMLVAWGAISAVLGVLFVEAMKLYVLFRKRFVWWRTSIVAQVMIVAAITALVQYPVGEFTTTNSFENIKKLVSRATDGSELVMMWTPFQIHGLNLLFNTVLFILVRFPVTVLCATLPLSSGVFGTLFELGALMGRIAGALLAYLFANSPSGWAYVNPGGYALVGGIAFSCAATNTISPAIIAFEATGDFSYLVPSLCAAVIGLAISRSSSNGIYDMMLKIRSLPYLYDDHARTKTGVVARDLMLSGEDLDVLCVKNATVESLRQLMNDPRFASHVSYPLVDSRESMRFIGGVQKSAVLNLLAQYPNSSEPIRFYYQIPASKEDGEPLHEFLKLPESESSTNTIEITVADAPEQSASNDSLITAEPSSVDVKVDVAVDDEKAALARMPCLEYNPAPFQTAALTPLAQVHYLFAMLGLAQVWVTDGAKLAGVISKKRLTDYSKSSV